MNIHRYCRCQCHSPEFISGGGGGGEGGKGGGGVTPVSNDVSVAWADKERLTGGLTSG